MTTLMSKVVPTEYDVERTATFGLPVLVDDRGRRFASLTLAGAFRKAEAAQDPNDPIHHPPHPFAEDVPCPAPR